MDLLRVDPYGLPRCLEGIQGRPLWKRTSRVVIFLREASWSHWARPVLLRSARAQAAMLQRKLILQLQPRPTPLPKLRPCIAATAPLTETSALRAWLSPRPKTVPSSPPAWMTISSCLLIRRASRPCRLRRWICGRVRRGQGAHVEDGEQRCYSASMKEKAQSTTPWLTSMKAIEAYCVGKKASDLTKTSLDAVTGATLVDAPNYLKLVSEVAGSDDITTTGAYAGDGSDLKMGCATAAAHGDKRSRKPFPLCRGTCWLLRASTSSSSPTLRLPAGARAQFGRRLRRRVRRGQGAHVQVGELRYVQRQHEGKGPVHYAVDRIHVAIESFVAGQKIADVKAKGPDAVSGATLVDTAGYVDTAVAAAKTA